MPFKYKMVTVWHEFQAKTILMPSRIKNMLKIMTFSICEFQIIPLIWKSVSNARRLILDALFDH